MPTTGERTWPDLITALVRREDLDVADTTWAMDTIMRGEVSPVVIAGFMIALRAKGETTAEVAGFVEAMYRHARLIDVPGEVVDIVGTGGDRAKTVNISTMSAIVAAGAGAVVVKHGNRAASSASGSADVLERLGVRLDLPVEAVAAVAAEAGITYCFAPLFHPALRHAAAARGELRVPTTFNVLGPLTNPARPRAQAVGVADLRLAPIMAGVLADRGVAGLVFHGDDGLDELTVTTTSQVWLVSRSGIVTHEVFDPRDIGIEAAPIEALRGADPAYNAEVARRLLAGERGPVRDAVLLSAGAGLVALRFAERDDAVTARPLAEWLAWGVAQGAEAIDSGAAAAALDRWITATRARL